jgi:hypothetical protein
LAFLTFWFSGYYMSNIKTATCHCGAIALSIDLSDGLDNVRRCNCSLCRRKGAIMATVPVEAITVTKGQAQLGLYQWNTNIARHYFCKICGIYTHHQRRSNPAECGFNIACLEGVDLNEFSEVLVADGAAMSLVDDS